LARMRTHQMETVTRKLEPDLPIRTERLLLRAFEESDFGGLYSYRSRPDVTRYLYWGPEKEAEVRIALDKKISATTIQEEGDFIALAAVELRTNRLVGDLTLWWRSREHSLGEIGFMVHPDHQGRGFATEGAREMLRLGFEGLGLHRVIGSTEARNEASARVLQKLGMRREAHLVENEFVKGGWQSEIIFAMLDREWSG